MRSRVQALTGKGRTPIGNSLLAVPDEPRPAEGRGGSGDPGLRRRRQLCPAGARARPPARSLNRASTSRSRSSACRSTSASGASWSASPRRAAAPTSASTTPTSSQTSWPRRSTRALRSYETAGTKVTGGSGARAGGGAADRALPGRPPAPGRDALVLGRRARGPASAHSSVSAIPSYDDVGQSALRTELQGARRYAHRGRCRGSSYGRGAGDIGPRARPVRCRCRSSRARAGCRRGATRSASRSRTGSTPTRCRSSSASSCSPSRARRPGSRARPVSSGGRRRHPTPSPVATPSAGDSSEPAEGVRPARGRHRGGRRARARPVRRAGADPQAGGMRLVVAGLVAALVGRRPCGRPGRRAGRRRRIVHDRAAARARHLPRHRAASKEYLNYGVRVAAGQRLRVTLQAGLTGREARVDLGVAFIQVNLHGPGLARSSTASRPAARAPPAATGSRSTP